MGVSNVYIVVATYKIGGELRSKNIAVLQTLEQAEFYHEELENEGTYQRVIIEKHNLYPSEIECTDCCQIMQQSDTMQFVYDCECGQMIELQE